MAVLYRQTGFWPTGPALLTSDYSSTDQPIWVDSVTGNDTNAGTNQLAPKASVFGASGALSVVTSGNSNLVVCFATHQEAVAAFAWTMSGVTLISLGVAGARAQFTNSGVITVSGTEVRIENCYFPASSAGIANKFSIGASGFEMRDCRLEAGVNDATHLVLVNAAANATFKGTTFTPTASVTGTTRDAINVAGASTNLLVEACTFDGSAYGWTSGFALNIVAAAATRFRLRNLTLANYSFAGASISGAKGYFSGGIIDSTSGWKWLE